MVHDDLEEEDLAEVDEVNAQKVAASVEQVGCAWDET